jgi:hypothetical protein
MKYIEPFIQFLFVICFKGYTQKTRIEIIK